MASTSPAAGEVGLVAVLEIGVTAALVAGAANWLIIRHHVRRLAMASQESGYLAVLNGQPLPDTGPKAKVSGPMPALIVDETDDAGGHRIHVNPWADESGQ